MGVEKIVVFFVDVFDSRDGGGVIDADGSDFFAELLMVVVKILQDAGEVTGIAYVHGIGEGGDGRLGLIDTGVVVLNYRVISVASE